MYIHTFIHIHIFIYIYAYICIYQYIMSIPETVCKYMALGFLSREISNAFISFGSELRIRKKKQGRR